MLIKMKVHGLTIDPFTNAPIVILKDSEEKNTLPIWIGILEASAIATEVEKITFSRPMTHDLLKEILTSVGADVLKIEVNDLKDNVYYATIHMSSGDNTFTIDARPSDAIALALRTSAPIFVDTKVLKESTSIDLRSDTVKKGTSSKEWLEMLEQYSPEDFGKYKM